MGWSFGFLPIRDSWDKEGDISHRELRELELKEVSILDNSKVPAYDGTSIETRDDDLIETREMEDSIETVATSQKDKNYKLKNKILATRASV